MHSGPRWPRFSKRPIETKIAVIAYGAFVGSFMNPHKLFRKALNGPKNLPFHDFLQLARAFGFQLARTNGSHHILIHDEVREPLNLQEVDGKAKPYQVRQFLRIVEDNDLTLGDES